MHSAPGLTRTVLSKSKMRLTGLLPGFQLPPDLEAGEQSHQPEHPHRPTSGSRREKAMWATPGQPHPDRIPRTWQRSGYRPDR